AGCGATAADVQDAGVSTVDSPRTFFYVDALESLRRGGRIGAGAALLATSLSVKPLLHVLDGQIVPLEKVRTSSKAIARLVQLTVAEARDYPVDLAVHHLAAPRRAAEVAAQLVPRIPPVAGWHTS